MFYYICHEICFEYLLRFGTLFNEFLSEWKSLQLLIYKLNSTSTLSCFLHRSDVASSRKISHDSTLNNFSMMRLQQMCFQLWTFFASLSGSWKLKNVTSARYKSSLVIELGIWISFLKINSLNRYRMKEWTLKYGSEHHLKSKNKISRDFSAPNQLRYTLHTLMLNETTLQCLKRNIVRPSRWRTFYFCRQQKTSHILI